MARVRSPKRFQVAAFAAAALAVVACSNDRGQNARRGGRGGAGGPAPVEVAPVETGPIELRRSFTGTLEAQSRFAVAANVGGRVTRLFVDLSDPIKQGQVVAELDDGEQVQGVAEAVAELAVAQATLADAESALEIAEREWKRLSDLGERGVVSAAEVDGGRTRRLAARTAVNVARAQVKRVSATVQRARIRSGYTRVIAAWTGSEGARYVAERHVDEGDTVGVGDPLVTVIGLSPLVAVAFVTEKEYSSLEAGQEAKVTTEAYEGQAFTARLARRAPVFNENSRQARVEFELPNEEGLLKPGMFVRVEAVLERVPEARVVPSAALAVRGGKTGVFVIDDAGKSVSWQPVETGIRQGERVQLVGPSSELVVGRVVTLGQQLIDDGSAVTIPDDAVGANNAEASE